MAKRFYFLIYLAILVSPAFSQDSIMVKQFYIGTDSVSTYSTCYNTCDSNIVFIHLHEDETTAVAAATEYLSENGGMFIQLKHTGKRLLNFAFRNRPYMVDPNRIFTRVGLKENMTKLKAYNPHVATEVSRFANEFLSTYILNKKLIIALHNNTENKYSILSYKKGNVEAANATRFFINKDMDPDDFILTTDTSIYRKIKEKNINVVLQSNRAKNDGSLSVYAHKNKIPYINIEAQHGHFEEQKQMLLAIKEIIAGYTDIIDLNYTGQ